MEKGRLEAIKKAGQKLYRCLKDTHFKRLDELETDEYRIFMITLNRMQKEALIWEIDDYLLLFPEGVSWKETQHVLLAYIYEQMHKDGINPKEV